MIYTLTFALLLCLRAVLFWAGMTDRLDPQNPVARRILLSALSLIAIGAILFGIFWILLVNWLIF